MGWMNRVALALSAVFILALLPGCSRQPDSFEQLLAGIDAQGLQAARDDFVRAGAVAGTSADKLRLLKRARQIDPGLTADLAASFTGPGASSVVGLAALDAFMESGRFGEAFKLFDHILPPADFPLEFAETLVMARRSGLASQVSSLDHSWLIRAFDATGHFEFMYEAIINSLVAGDTGTARLLLDENVSKGALQGTKPVVNMLWHHGFLDLILALGSEDSSYEALAAYADSALLTGQKALATAVYAELIERYPLQSWKPYAALARLAEQAIGVDEDHPMPLAPLPAPRNPEAGYWYALMLERFPENDSATLEYGLWLARRGSIDAAEPYLKNAVAEYRSLNTGKTNVEADGMIAAEIAARLALAGMEILPLAAIEVASSYPGSAEAVDPALAALFFTASWNRFLSLNARREVDVPRAWFWDAASLVLAGDFEPALQSLLRSSPMVPGFEVPYMIATCEFSLGLYKNAAVNYMIAAGEADASSVKARCMVRAGDSFFAAGELSAAANAYEAALGIEDFNMEAMAALRRFPTP